MTSNPILADAPTNEFEVILTSTTGSQDDLSFGNAVRAGNETEVSRLLSKHGLDILLAEMSFKIKLDIDTRLTPPIIRRNTTFQNAVVESNNECLSKHGFMTVTPFQLGLLAQHRHIIKLLIEKILETNDNETQLEWLKRVLGTKTSLKIPDDAVPCDKGTLSLDGMNAFHLATKYQPKALKDILYILNEKNLMSNLSYLLEERDWRLKQTPLHIAAKCPTAEVAR